MGKLGDVLGEDFEQDYKKTTQQRREESNKVTQETLKEICYKAINGGGFKGEEPRFTFDAGSVDHDVLLMESPQQDIDKFIHSFEDGGMSVGMFHMGTLMNGSFNDDMVDLVDKIKEDEYYLVVGRYVEKTEMDGDGNEKTYYNISPVRGILPLTKAKSFAQKFEEDKEGTSIDEQKQDQSGDGGDSDSNGSSGSIDINDSDSDGPSDEDVLNVLEAIAGSNGDVIKATAEGDMDSLDRIVSTVNDNVEGDVTQDHVVDVFESEVGEIDWPEEDDDDDDSLDLGSLDGDDDEEEVEEEDTGSAESEDDNDDSASADDWF